MNGTLKLLGVVFYHTAALMLHSPHSCQRSHPRNCTRSSCSSPLPDYRPIKPISEAYHGFVPAYRCDSVTQLDVLGRVICVDHVQIICARGECPTQTAADRKLPKFVRASRFPRRRVARRLSIGSKMRFWRRLEVVEVLVLRNCADATQMHQLSTQATDIKLASSENTGAACVPDVVFKCCWHRVAAICSVACWTAQGIARRVVRAPREFDFKCISVREASLGLAGARNSTGISAPIATALKGLVGPDWSRAASLRGGLAQVHKSVHLSRRASLPTVCYIFRVCEQRNERKDTPFCRRGILCKRRCTVPCGWVRCLVGHRQ